MKRTLAHGRWIGFISGLGAATADALYALLAAFGLTVATLFLVKQQSWVQVLGGSFLIYLGIQTIRSPVSRSATLRPFGGSLGAYSSTLLLTLANPMTILSFTGVFAGAGLSVQSDTILRGATTMVLGVFLGSAVWWVILTLLIGRLRERVTQKRLQGINLLSGAVITLFGLWQLWRVFSAPKLQ